MDGLLRGDTKTRYESYQVARQNGWLNANDVRSLENLNPIPGDAGKVYLIPLNMQDASKINEIKPVASNPFEGNDDE